MSTNKETAIWIINIFDKVLNRNDMYDSNKGYLMSGKTMFHTDQITTREDISKVLLEVR